MADDETPPDEGGTGDNKELRAKDMVRAKDLLRAGELDTEQRGAEKFGRDVMQRRLRRPVGNSEKLWKRVDGEDPWELDKPKKKVEKQRGVYAAGRFVRVDKAEQSKSKKDDPNAHIPDWARNQQRRRESAVSAPEVKATPTATDPLERLKQIIAQKNDEAAAKRDKASDAASRMAKSEPAAAPPEQELSLEDRLPPAPSTSGRVSKAGRLRNTSARRPTARAMPSKPSKAKAYAAGRSPHPAEQHQGPPEDLPVEMRRPPIVDPNAKKPVKRKKPYGAGRGPDRSQPKAPKDIPIEMRRPPRVGKAARGSEAPARATRMAAGRQGEQAPAPTKKTDLPVELRTPPRPGAPAAPPAPTPEAAPAPAAKAVAAPAAEPVDRTPPKPKPPPAPVERAIPSPGGGGMDDLFGMASMEGPMRIGRRSRKKASAETEKAKPEAPKGPAQPPFPIPKPGLAAKKGTSAEPEPDGE